ncbi:MAG: alpha-L-rhamnosidase C-terminal domain-containing protein [Silvibacterium sp.]
MRLNTLIIPVLSFHFSISAAAQMGDPSVGPTKIPNQDLDPTRSIQAPVLESTIHRPLPEQYIWTKDDAVPENPADRGPWNSGTYQDLTPHYFRRTFNLSSVPAHATLYLAGPRSATIYLNGQNIGSYQLNLDFAMSICVYAYDVTNALHAGQNVLAIEAVRGPEVGNGADSRVGIQQTHGEVLAVKITPAVQGMDAPPLLISDTQWKASMHAAPDWQNAAFDDQSWQSADSLGGIESSIEFFQWNADAGMYAWPGYDGISPFLAQYHLAAVKISNIYSGAGKLTNTECLWRPCFCTYSGPFRKAEFFQYCSSGSPELTVELPTDSVTEHNAPQIQLDFGREVVGRLELQSDSDEPADVTVQYGESEGEASNQPYLGIDPIHIAPHAIAYGPKSAFRYALVRFTGGKNIRYKTIRLNGIEYPVTYKGYFSSSDPELNQMWAIGAYTAHLCMQDDIWDAPKRDRGRWMGDLDVSGSTIEDAFDDHFLMNETLDRLLGVAPIQQDVNGIPGYSAFWVIGEAEYFRHTGSVKQLESTHTRLVQLLHYMETELDQRDLFANQHHTWPFVDWSPELYGDTPEARRATQFEFYAAFSDGAWLLRQLHDTTNADLFQKRADAMKVAAQKYLLDPSGSFGTRWQTNAYAVLSGVADPSQYPAIWQNALSSVGHVKYNALIITPYYNYYVISAMAKMSHRADALNWIRQYWGGMVNEGATSFWEGYDPSWYKGSDFHDSLQADAMSGYRVSLAHGWSSGVTPWLMEQILGIHPTGPGFSTVNIRPDLIDLQWAKGAEPTPNGMLGVAIRKDNGDVITIDLPPDTNARVSVPVPTPTAQVLVNGKAQSSTPDEDGKRAIIKLTQPGHYEIQSR